MIFTTRITDKTLKDVFLCVAVARRVTGSLRTSSTYLSDHRRRTASESASANISSASASSTDAGVRPTWGLLARRRTTEVIVKRRRAIREPKTGWPTRVRLFVVSIVGGAGRSLATGGAAVAVAVPIESGGASVAIGIEPFGRHAVDSISNSSLRDVEDHDLKTELATYLDDVRWK